VTLGHVLCGGHAKRWYFLFRKIINNGQRLEGCQRANYAMDLVSLDQLLSLGPRRRRDAGGICHDQINFATREVVIAFLQEHRQRKVHVDATRGKRTSLCRQQTDANGLAALGEHATGDRQMSDTRASNAANESSSRYRHWILPELISSEYRFYFDEFIGRKR
jgi:hypothetical protein